MANETLNKIDKYLKALDEKMYQKNKKGKELKFLYKTEAYQEALEEGRDEEYKKVFLSIAKKQGIDPEEIENLDKDKKKKFFDAVDKAWKAEKETD